MRGLIFFLGITRAFSWPALTAIKAFLVPREAYANSSTWASSSWQLAVVAGPGISGFLYSFFGFSNTLLFVMALVALSILSFLMIKEKKIEQQQTDATMLEKIKEGFRYVFKTKIILYSISIDMFSVLFGGVVAILPVFAQDILNVGPEGLGV